MYIFVESKTRGFAAMTHSSILCKNLWSLSHGSLWSRFFERWKPPFCGERDHSFGKSHLHDNFSVSYVEVLLGFSHKFVASISLGDDDVLIQLDHIWCMSLAPLLPKTPAGSRKSRCMCQFNLDNCCTLKMSSSNFVKKTISWRVDDCYLGQL